MNHLKSARWNSGGLFVAAAVLASMTACDGSPTKPSPACTFQIAPSSTTIGATGGNVNVTVTTAANCAWTARANASWLSIVSGASGTGSGVAVVAGTENPDTSARQGSVTVAEQNITFSQAPREVTCQYSTSLESQTFGANGGTGRIQVTATDGCRWTAAVDGTWITLSTTEGTGNGEVGFSVAEWNGSEPRSTTIRVAGRTTIIRQDREPPVCTYSVDPVEFTLHWHQTGGDIHVQAGDGCTWTAASGESWLGVPPLSTSGPGTVTFSVGQLTSSTTRRAPVMLRWPTETAGQNVWVNQEGCWYAIGERDKTFTKDGGKAFLSVFGTPMSTNCMIGCPWTAVSDVPWIQVLGSGSGVGDDGIWYVVAANPGPGTRVGRIVAAGYTLVITQTF